MGERGKTTEVPREDRWPAVSEEGPEFQLQSQKARYRALADKAARLEREGYFTEAAGHWMSAQEMATGGNLDWCSSRMRLCLAYASTPAGKFCVLQDKKKTVAKRRARVRDDINHDENNRN